MLQRSILAAIIAFSFFLFPSSSQAQVNIIQAPANFEFVDMGYDIQNDEVGIVGYVVNGTDKTATVFELNANQDGFTAQTLADLPGATTKAEVSSISSDAVRIAGFSSSADSVNLEGATWLRNNPLNPTGIGFLPNASNNSVAVGAWSDGIVGSSGGANRAIKWDETNGISQLPGTAGGQAQAQNSSSNGEIIAGFASHEIFGGAAYYWQKKEIHRLNDTVQGFDSLNSYARNIAPNGNYMGGDIVLRDAQDNFLSVPAVWEGTERTLTVLTDEQGSIVQGSVSDVSDLGYAVGTFFDSSFNAFGFITEGSGEAMEFDEWLLDLDPTASLGFDSVNVTATHWDSLSKTMRFIAAGENGEFAYVSARISSVPEPSSVSVLFAAMFLAACRRRRSLAA